jgi:hypothetical protein
MPNKQQKSDDFAEENAHPGFEASIPVKSGEDQTGPLEGFDPGPNESHEGWWDRFKRRIRENRQRSEHPHP